MGLRKVNRRGFIRLSAWASAAAALPACAAGARGPRADSPAPGTPAAQAQAGAPSGGAPGRPQGGQVFPIPARRGPVASLLLAVEDGALVLDGSATRPDAEDGAAIVRYAWAARDGNPAPLLAAGGGALEGARVTLATPPVDGEYYLSLQVEDAAGRQDSAASYFVVAEGQPRVPDFDREHPAWIDRAVVYGVIPRKFGDPALAGVTERLDDLKELGVDALWLAPINPSPPGDFGYAVLDYVAVHPGLGTKEEFRRLVREAHARGIRVLIDFVPNHSSAEHPFFQDAQRRGQESPYYDFYNRDGRGAPTHYFDWEHLPDLNFDNPEVERFMLAAFAHWVREHDVDGFRVDVAWGVKERKPDFWPRWRRELQRIKPDLLLIAEASARDPYYFDNGFDAAYDWTGELGKWAWEKVFDPPAGLPARLHAALTNGGAGFHPDALVFRFLNNNDTGTRFISEHGEGMARVAAALLLTLPGLPCVYTGDEIGAWYRPYADKLPLSWEERYPGLRDHYRRLIALRKAHPALHSPRWLPLDARPAEHVYAYARLAEPLGPPALVLLNFSDQAREAELDLPADFAARIAGKPLRDLLADAPLTPSVLAPFRVPLPAWGARVLVPEVT